jgi:hypothetical protein
MFYTQWYLNGETVTDNIIYLANSKVMMNSRDTVIEISFDSLMNQ